MDWMSHLNGGLAIVSAILVIGAALVKLVRSASRLEIGLTDIKENHLPHLHSEIQALRADFTRHLEAHATKDA